MTVTLQQQLTTPMGAYSKSLSATALAQVSLDAETVPIATDTLMNIAFPYATIKAYYLCSTVACTIETNATDATGGDTITLAANVPKVFIDGGDETNVFTANVTKFYVTAAAAGTLTAFVAYDPTP